LVSLLLAALGVQWMFTPAQTAAALGIELKSAVAFNTARGDLGGMFLAGAALGLIGIRSGDGRWLQALALLIGFVAVGRTVGMMSDGFAAMSAISVAIEIAMVAILLHAASQT
jgi:hypothetical protein